jgi:hypothetical protein
VSGVTRREALRTGGLVLSLGAVAAACAAEAAGSEAPGRIGVAPPAPTLPPAVMDDMTLLRTAQSLEYTALELYAALIATGALTGDEPALFDRLVADHTEHAAQIGQLITAQGGTEYTCANSFIMDRSVNPSLAAMEGSDDVHRDVLNIAYSFEALFGASYQSFVRLLKAQDLRRAITLVGTEEQRHETVLARIINPDETFAPTFFGEPEEKDADGFPIPYAIPSVFGRVSPIELVVGAPNDEGARFSTLLQTPAENSFVYDYMSC